MPITNVGESIIEAYLKGVAVRQQKEEQESRSQIAERNAELRAQQLQQNWDIAQARLKEQGQYHKDTLKQKEADYNLRLRDARSKLARDIQQGYLEPDPNNPGEFRETKVGTAARIATENKVEEFKALTQPTVDRALSQELAVGPAKARTAGMIATAQFPTRAQLQGQLAKYQSERQEDQQRFIVEQNALNRAAALQRIEVMRAAKGEQDEEVIGGYLTGARSGDLTKEYLNTVGPKVKERVFGELAKQGERALTVKEQTKLDEIGNLNSYIRLSEDLNKLLKGRSIAEAWADPQVKDRVGQLNSLAKIFAVNIPNDRSILSEKEVPRIQQGVVQLNPGGWQAFVPGKNFGKVDSSANERRIEEFKEAYKRGINTVIGKVSDAQKSALYEKYQVNPEWMKTREERIKEKQPALTKPSAMPKKAGKGWIEVK